MEISMGNPKIFFKTIVIFPINIRMEYKYSKFNGNALFAERFLSFLFTLKFLIEVYKPNSILLISNDQLLFDWWWLNFQWGKNKTNLQCSMKQTCAMCHKISVTVHKTVFQLLHTSHLSATLEKVILNAVSQLFTHSRQSARIELNRFFFFPQISSFVPFCFAFDDA